MRASSKSPAASRYDAVPYTRRPFAQSHPDRLAVLAKLLGMRPAPVDRCRLLELGCAGGGNLIPMACSLLESRFLGVDVSSRQVADARAIIAAVGLTNIEIRQDDIASVTRRLGKFDYIVAHGVYSWVPDTVQDKILRICRDNLTPEGVAYVSFNCYPGWHFREMIREMMLYHTRRYRDPQEQIAQARTLLASLAQATPPDNAFGMVLRDELKLLSQHTDSYLFHDHLEDTNEPVYFHEFIERAGRHGLQYLAEADVSSMMIDNLPLNAAETLRSLASDLLGTEQYIDFLRNRSLRQTLLCKRENDLKRDLTPELVKQFHVACAAKPVSRAIDINSSNADVFKTPNGVTLTTENPLVKAAFQILAELWPQSAPFDALVTSARARLGAPVGAGRGDTESNALTLASQILHGYLSSFVVLRTRQGPFVTKISDRPVVSPLARHQARTGDPVTNQLHEAGDVDELVRQILQLLDGRNDRGAIVDRLVSLAQDGNLSAFDRGAVPAGQAALRNHFASALDNYLAQFARLALLIA